MKSNFINLQNSLRVQRFTCAVKRLWCQTFRQFAQPQVQGNSAQDQNSKAYPLLFRSLMVFSRLSISALKRLVRALPTAALTLFIGVSAAAQPAPVHSISSNLDEPKNSANIALGASYVSVLDEYAKPFMAYTFGASLGVHSLPNWVFGVGSSFSQPTDLNVDDTTHYGLGDLRLGGSRKASIIDQDTYGHLSPYFSFILPTSERSNLTGLIVNTSSGLTWKKELFPVLSIGASSGVSVNAYHYETANRYGSSQNSPLGYNYSGNISLVLFQGTSIFTSVGRYHRVDYQQRWDIIQSFSAGLTSELVSGLSAAMGYSWRDKEYSNDPLLDLSKSDFSFGLAMTF